MLNYSGKDSLEMCCNLIIGMSLSGKGDLMIMVRSSMYISILDTLFGEHVLPTSNHVRLLFYYFTKYLYFKVVHNTTSVVTCWGTVAVRMSGSQSREPGFESYCCCFESFSFIPHCYSSLSCLDI